MDILQYIFRFLHRIRWWLIIAPIVVAIAVYIGTRNMERTFPVDMTIYTGIVSGYAMETGESNIQNTTIVNNTIDNIINIILSKETLHNVSLHLYARHMIYGDSSKDNEYILAENYRHLQKITPPDVKKLIDKKSEKITVDNLKTYEKASPQNFVYGLFNWNHPHYCSTALSKIKVSRLGNSDMLKVSYAANDPGVAYQTLVLLNQMYAKEYKTLQFSSTNNAIRYFEEELDRTGKELKENEDALMQYNIENRVINYDEQTKQVASIGKEYDLRYQDILLDYNSANASIKHLETQLDENVQFLKGNAEFLSKLNKISNLNTKISEMEIFYPDSITSSTHQRFIKNQKRQLADAENELLAFSNEFGNRKFTRDGYPTSNFITQWLDELLKFEKAKAEIKVMNNLKTELNKQYSHYSPIGSTLKQRERNIDFIERNYLSILSGLNAARLRVKSLEMNSASLKLINPPIFPLNAEPSKRKTMVLAAYAGTLVFLLGFFLLFELLDRTLRNRIRTERITGGNVLGALPEKENRQNRKYSNYYMEKAGQNLANSIQNYFKQGDSAPFINIISAKKGTGKSELIEILQQHWKSRNISVQVAKYDQDFNPDSLDFLFIENIRELTASKQQNYPTIYLIEQAPLESSSIPKTVLQKSVLNVFVVRSDWEWTEDDDLLFNRLSEQCGETPIKICLNHAEKETVEGFTGMLPPFTFWQRYFNRHLQYKTNPLEK